MNIEKFGALNIMETIKISCPKCGTIVDLTAAVQEDLVRELQERAEQTASEKLALEMESLQQEVEEKSRQLAKAGKLELELRRQKRELDERLENVELEVARKLDDERKQIALDAREKADEESRLKILEYQKKLSDLQAELEAAKRKAEQGSQQMQGEVAELDLEDALRGSFPHDEIEPVGKGVKGADIIQRVKTTTGQFCGTIIWESKNTRNWNDRWLSKLKEDQLASKADIAIIVSSVLPGDVANFACVDGIWITDPLYTIGLATALRETLVLVTQAKQSLMGKDEKVELLYRYLSGTEFKQRIEMIVETFRTLKYDLESEKRAMTRIWSQREKSIEKVVTNVSGMYGDLQGIIGAALPTIKSLELPEPAEDI